jgi:polyisoprenoid-binding protein YceI
MRCRFFRAIATALIVLLASHASARAADDYRIDAIHSGVSFKVSHLGLSWIPGRFNDVSGSFTVDKDEPSKSSFSLTIKAESIDTGNRQRDQHLKSPDFFNVKQFPLLTFKSTSVKATKGGYMVTGDFSMHGQTQSITFTLTGGKQAEFPRGFPRTGFTTDLVLKRSDYGMEKFKDALGDEVQVSVSFEGVKK